MKLKFPIMANKAVAQWVSSLGAHHWEGWLKLRLPGHTPEPLIQWVWAGGLRICITRKFPKDAAAAGLGTPL